MIRITNIYWARTCGEHKARQANTLFALHHSFPKLCLGGRFYINLINKQPRKRTSLPFPHLVSGSLFSALPPCLLRTIDFSQILKSLLSGELRAQSAAGQMPGSQHQRRDLRHMSELAVDQGSSSPLVLPPAPHTPTTPGTRNYFTGYKFRQKLFPLFFFFFRSWGVAKYLLRSAQAPSVFLFLSIIV